MLQIITKFYTISCQEFYRVFSMKIAYKVGNDLFSQLQWVYYIDYIHSIALRIPLKIPRTP